MWSKSALKLKPLWDNGTEEAEFLFRLILFGWGLSLLKSNFGKWQTAMTLIYFVTVWVEMEEYWNLEFFENFRDIIKEEDFPFFLSVCSVLLKIAEEIDVWHSSADSFMSVTRLDCI